MDTGRQSEPETSIDAITEEEITGRAPMKNAFTELMSPTNKHKAATTSPTKQAAATAGSTKIHNAEGSKKASSLSVWDPRSLNFTHGRDALGVYIADPEAFQQSRVISFDDNFVVIRDVYPKSSLHLLLLPRKPLQLLKVHPFNALDGSDAAFLAAVKAETAKWKAFAASELRRVYGQFSASDAARNRALDADIAGEAEAEADLPPGRDWAQSIISGFHAGPSMNHLHVHILSVDRHSEAVRHRKHYNSFATPFLVPVEDLPLAPDDPRRYPGREGYLDWDLKCWRCKKNFGNKFAVLKRHLEAEFEAWKKE